MSFGIGLHRPYFAHSTTQSLAEADVRYKIDTALAPPRRFTARLSMDILPPPEVGVPAAWIPDGPGFVRDLGDGPLLPNLHG
jgi:hypothetical protein